MIWMDGKALAAKRKAELRGKVDKLPRKPGLAPTSTASAGTVKSAGFTARNTPCPPGPPRRTCWPLSMS